MITEVVSIVELYIDTLWIWTPEALPCRVVLKIFADEVLLLTISVKKFLRPQSRTEE
jgi:hypothetical protein